MPDLDHEISKIDPAAFKAMIEQVIAAFPNFEVVATTLRNAVAVQLRRASFESGRQRERPGANPPAASDQTPLGVQVAKSN